MSILDLQEDIFVVWIDTCDIAQLISPLISNSHRESPFTLNQISVLISEGSMKSILLSLIKSISMNLSIQMLRKTSETSELCFDQMTKYFKSDLQYYLIWTKDRLYFSINQ